MRTTSICLCGLALALAATTFTGCSRGKSSDTSSISKQTVEKYLVSGILKETDGFTLPGTVTLEATDNNGPVKLYSDKTGGKEISSITAADDGMVSFFVDGAAIPPITIKAWGATFMDNHAAGSSMFTINKPGTTFFALKIIDLEGPSQGVLPHVENGTLDLDDKLGTPFSMQLSSAQVTIPTGTLFQDGSGNNLKGTVKASLTEFASSTTTAPLIDPDIFDSTLYNPEDELLSTAVLKASDLDNFPGGMNNTHASAGAGYFATAGFVAVNVTDGEGKQAKKIATGTFDIRMNISAGTINPNTDLPVVAGDTIPIFTYDEKTLLWKAEVDGAGTPVLGLVQTDPLTGGLYVLHTTNHFSFWNLGWLATGTGTSCTATMNLQKDAIAMPLTLTATMSGKKCTTLLTNYKPAGDTTITVANVPNQLLKIVLTDPMNNVIWTSPKAGVNWCAAPINASYTAPVSKKAVAITVKVTEFCTQDPSVTQAVPSTPTQVTTAVLNGKGILPPILYKPISFAVTDSAGTSTHNLVPGAYTITAYDRRTATYFPLPVQPATVPLNPITVVKATPQTVFIKIPVTCIPPITGSTGGTGYSF